MKAVFSHALQMCKFFRTRSHLFSDSRIIFLLSIIQNYKSIWYWSWVVDSQLSGAKLIISYLSFFEPENRHFPLFNNKDYNCIFALVFNMLHCVRNKKTKEKEEIGEFKKTHCYSEHSAPSAVTAFKLVILPWFPSIS